MMNAFQRRVLGAGITVVAVLVLVAAVYGLFLVLKSFVATFSGVLLPLAVAMVLATLMKPFVRLIEARSRLGRHGSVAALCVVFLLSVLAMAAWVLPVLFFQLGELIDVTSRQVAGLADLINSRREAWGMNAGVFGDNTVRDLISEFSGYFEQAGRTALAALEVAGSGLLGLASAAAMWAVMPVYLLFLLGTDEKVLPKLNEQLSFVPDNIRDDILYLVREFSDILIAYFRGQVTIAVLTGLILGVGFSVIGLKAGLLIGFVAGLANLVPYLGTTLGVLSILPYAYFVNNGGFGMLISSAIVFAGAQLIQDYILTPRVMGERTGLGPMTVIFAIFFWGTALDGILGVIMAIPLMAFFTVFWRLAKSKYLPAFLSSRCPVTGVSD